MQLMLNLVAPCIVIILADNNGNNPLLEAIKNGQDQVISMLVEAGASLDMNNAGNFLRMVVAKGDLEFVTRVLANRINLNSKNYDLRTPLHIVEARTPILLQLFPVERIHHHLKTRTSAYGRVRATTIIYFIAILEYITAQVLELVGNANKDLKAKRITPSHLQLAIRGDEELDTLIKGTIAGGGVIPHIHKSLINKTSKE
ncbi:probable histone H2A variant 1 [Tanacetum coccineum]